MRADCWYEPLEILNEVPKEWTIERRQVRDFDQALICGIIRERKSKKIVEIGIAEGGTTAVIAKAVSMLELDSRIYGVDLSRKLYYDDRYESGCICSYFNDKYGWDKMVSILTGRTIAGQLERIGKGIDLVFIDSAHVLPGELLDFLAILPYLSKDAVVLVHDVSLNYLGILEGTSDIIAVKKSVATKILLGTVCADKYTFLNDKDEFINIGCFQITEDTYKNVRDIFWMLSMTWEYMPEKSVLDEYHNIIKLHYDKELLRIYNAVVSSNLFIHEKMLEEAEKRQRYKVKDYVIDNDYRKIIVWGLGKRGKPLCDLLLGNGVDIVAGIDQSAEEYKGIRVIKPYMEIPDCDLIILAFPHKGYEDLIRKIKSKRKCILLDDF